MRGLLRVLALVGLCAFAAAASAAEMSSEDVLKAVSERYRTVKPGPEAVAMKYVSASPTGIADVYEVLATISTPQGESPVLLYFHPPTGKAVGFGILLDADGSPAKESMGKFNALRQQASSAKNAEFAKALQTLDLKDAIKVGDGPVRVVEVYDPDCGYCRKMSEYIEGRHRGDVTRYVYLFPLRQIHPNAEAKSRHILCAQDPAAELAKALRGEYDASFPAVSKNYCEERLGRHLSSATRLGLSGTPLLYVGGSRVDGFNVQLVTQLIESEKARAKNEKR